MICAGVDSGSRATKVALLDAGGGALLAAGVVDAGLKPEAVASALLDRLLAGCARRRDEVGAVVATGYARHAIGFAGAAVTEITCHATGVRRVVPGAATVVEIGGQDAKLLRLAPDGTVQDFAMNDRCAAGTGRFLEVVAARLGVPLEGLGALARAATAPAAISSMCVVFAETEIIGLLAQETPPADIVAGVQKSIASRVAGMARRRVDPPVVFTGGVARIPGMAEALAEALGAPVATAPDPQMTGALGAAILACRRLAGGA